MIENSDQLSELDLRLQERHKRLFTSVVMPVIIIPTIFLLASHWRHDALFYSGLAVCLFLDVFNVFFSVKNRRIPSPWGPINSRSDSFDSFRWCLNIVGDVFLVYSLQTSTAVAVVIWLILSFGALTEVYQSRNRLITFSFAMTGFLATLALQQVPLLEAIFLVISYCGLVMVLFQLERWITDEMRSFQEETQMKEQAQNEAQTIIKEAVIGSQARMLMHEVNNMLFIIQGASELESSATSPKSKRNYERITRSVNVLARLSRIVLEDLHTETAEPRVYSISDLVQDIDLLLGKHFSSNEEAKVTIALTIADEELGFIEQPGTTYLIIHNLVKNGIEAAMATEQAVVTLSSDIVDDRYVLTITDNGPGMSQEQIAQFNQIGRTPTTKATGHGIGLEFITRHAELNGFDLIASKAAGKGMCFQLTIPINSCDALSDELAA